ncbi:MAG: hypothetical protein LBP73_03640 [Clostridiales Family XIII bacterium]|jgi:hypothetical protein|nr:hypothetical protein [Clostridiales Family XIII bacterium]
MLTLDRPISLVVREGALGPSDSFGERLRANYEIMTAMFSAEELLFLLVNPPEIPYPEGDFIHIAMGDVRRDTQNIVFGVVNNIVNRILLEDNSALSYQDTVYLDMALRKLGIENVASFMEQVRVLRAETGSVHRLTKLYGDHLQILRETLAREVEPHGGTAKTAEAESGAFGKERALYLHSEIYRRLGVPQLVHVLARFARSASETHTRVDAREMRISEQQRTAMVFALNEYRREIPAFRTGDIYYNRNRYETGDVLAPPKDEASALRQALSAALLQVVDNVTMTRAEYPAGGRDVWIDVREALRASARDSVERYLSFRAYAADGAAARRESADLQSLTLLSRNEEAVLSRHLAHVRISDERRGEGEAADGAAADTPQAGAAKDAAAARDVRERARETLLELARISVARLHALETSVRRTRERVTEEARSAPLPGSPGRLAAEAPEAQGRPPGEDAVPLLTHAAQTPRAEEESAAYARETDPGREAEAAAGRADAALPSADGAARAQTPSASPPFMRAAAREASVHTESERETLVFAGEAALRAGEARGDGAGEADASSAGVGAPGVLRDGALQAALSRIMETAPSVHETERAETLLSEIERETRMLAPAETFRAEGTAAADEGEGARRGEADAAAQGEGALREMLDRVDRENKERMERVRELRTEIVHDAPAAPRPDRQRIMRDALRAIENPDLVLSEALAREAAAPSNASGAAEPPLICADEPSRRIMELLRLLQKDPAAAVAAGVTVAESPATLLADIAAAEKARAEAAAPPAAALGHVAPRESAESPVERRSAAFEAAPRAARAAAEARAGERPAPIVHRKPPATPDFEELLRRRSERSVFEERARREETTETTVRTNEIRTQGEQLAQNLVASGADDITEMINKTLMRQIGTIADRVYGQLEKKLQNEKSRRGRI